METGEVMADDNIAWKPRTCNQGRTEVLRETFQTHWSRSLSADTRRGRVGRSGAGAVEV